MSHWITELPFGEALTPDDWPQVIAADLHTAMAPPDLEVRFDESSALHRAGDRIQADLQLTFLDEDGALAGAADRFLDTGSAAAYHRHFGLTEDWQREGRGPQALRTTADLYRQLGIESIILEASDIGRYVWARCGFDFVDEAARSEVLDDMVPFARELGFALDRNSIEHAWELATLPQTVTGQQVAAVADPGHLAHSGVSFETDREIRLGKALLLASELPSWSACLSLDTTNTGFRLMQAYTR